MIRRPPISTRTDTLFPYTTLFRSLLHGFVPVYGNSSSVLVSCCGNMKRDGGRPRKTAFGNVAHLEHFSALVVFVQQVDNAFGGGCKCSVRIGNRSDERRVGKECVRTCRASGWPYPSHNTSIA